MSKVEILKQKGNNFLWIDDYLVMWDIPVERKIQKQIAERAFGDVLVAGYGLGIVQEYLTKNSKVKSLLTIEKLEEVVKKTEKAYGKLYGDVKIGDFYNCNPGKKFDCVIGDVWSDLVPEDLKNYREFREKAKELLKPNGKTLAWGQEFFEYLLKKKPK